MSVVAEPTAIAARDDRSPGAAKDAAHRRLALEVPIVLCTEEFGWGRSAHQPSSEPNGGTEMYTLMLARGLRARGYRVSTICHAGEALAPLRSRLAEIGVPSYPVLHSARSLRERLRRHRGVAAVVRSHPRCVLALMAGGFFLGGSTVFAGAVAGAGAIVRADLAGPEPDHLTRRHRLLLRLKDRLVDRVVVGSVENREAFVRDLGRAQGKIEIIHTGIELARFVPGRGRSEVRTAFGYDSDELVVGTISRLNEKRKGMPHFLEMAARLAKTCPRARFLVVGDGVGRPVLERKASALGLGDVTRFAGWRSDVPEVLAAMDVFVMPSLYEGGPTTVLEAMAMAKAVVATRVGMVPEVMDDGADGLTVPPGDSGALADAVLTLLGDEARRLRLAANARAKAERSLSVDSMVERYLEVFGDAWAERSGRKPPH